MTERFQRSTTLATESEQEPSSSPRAEPSPALILGWSSSEPWRVGEVAPIPPGDPGPYVILGRGCDVDDEPGPRVVFARHRPMRIELAPPLANPRISRVQLRVRARGPNAIEVVNVGRCRLLHNGVEASHVVAGLGDVLEVGAQLLLIVGARTPGIDLDAPSSAFPFGEADASGWVGESEAAWDLRKKIAFVAAREGHVLVHGASGAGKELVARALHALSPRGGARPLVSRNAATFPEGLIDAELFGNVKNYPNVGMAEREGLIGEAAGGTLFLDELAELPHSLQTHLLRVLDAGEYQRLGDARVRRAQFRLVAATNRPIDALKSDVAARLVFRIDVPDLNARREDIPLLVRHLLREIARTDASIARRFEATSQGAEPQLAIRLARMLVSRNYTTHVRELKRLLWEAIAASPAGVLDLPDAPPEPRPTEPPADVTPGDDAAPGERASIQAALDAHNGAIEPTWRALGLASRHALARLIKKHGIEVRRRSKAP